LSRAPTLIATLAVAYGGVHNIAAGGDHTAGVRWFLDRTTHASVRAPQRPRSRRSRRVVKLQGRLVRLEAQAHPAPGAAVGAVAPALFRTRSSTA
jgi:hypothetical protein